MIFPLARAYFKHAQRLKCHPCDKVAIVWLTTIFCHTVHRCVYTVIYVYARPLSSWVSGSLHKLCLTCRRKEREKTHLLRFFLFFLFLSFFPRSCCYIVWRLGVKFACMYKRKWNVELSITNDSFFYLDRRMRNTTNFIKWENDTMEKVLMRGGLRAFGNGKKYSLKYISSIFLCHKNLKFSWLSSCTAKKYKSNDILRTIKI